MRCIVTRPEVPDQRKSCAKVPEVQFSRPLEGAFAQVARGSVIWHASRAAASVADDDRNHVRRADSIIRFVRNLVRNYAGWFSDVAEHSLGL
jgi:hypothetical protein